MDTLINSIGPKLVPLCSSNQRQSLQGNQGTGMPRQPGRLGNQESQGNQGNQGSHGNQESQGNQGNQGSHGNQGSQSGSSMIKRERPHSLSHDFYSDSFLLSFFAQIQIPKALEPVPENLSAISADVLAQQLTLIEHELYSRIKP